MMTNTKLLQEITIMTQENNEGLREKLRQQILEGTSELNRSALQDFSQKYHSDFNQLVEELRHKHNDLLSQIDNSCKKLNEDLTSKISRTITESNQSILNNIVSEYNSKIEDLRSDINQKIDSQSESILYIGKALSESINNLQRDNSIIMETLQLILTNLIIDGVNNK